MVSESPVTRPYANLPSYADVEYVDGKLHVARGIIRRTGDPGLRRRWLQTVDILLDQRNALTEHGLEIFPTSLVTHIRQHMAVILPEVPDV